MNTNWYSVHAREKKKRNSHGPSSSAMSASRSHFQPAARPAPPCAAGRRRASPPPTPLAGPPLSLDRGGSTSVWDDGRWLAVLIRLSEVCTGWWQTSWMRGTTTASGSRRAADGPCKALGFSWVAPWLRRRAPQRKRGSMRGRERGENQEEGEKREMARHGEHGGENPSCYQHRTPSMAPILLFY